MAFFLGNKIETGLQMNYNTGVLKDEEKFFISAGIGLLYYKISNIRDHYDGFIFGGTFPFAFQYFVSEHTNGFYAGTTIKLMSGQEKISYGYQDKTYFFFGPSIEPHVGFKFFNTISIDAGFYLITLWGSKMLPEDTGAKFNLNIWF
jgi:hypothetical protein